MNKIKLKKVWRFGRSGNKTHLYNFSTTKHYAFDDASGEIFFIFKILESGASEHLLVSQCSRRFIDCDKSFVSNLIKTLKKINALENNNRSKANLFPRGYLLGLDRQVEFFREIFPDKNPWLVQKTIKNSNIAILGLGTIAHHIIPGLIASGIGSYTCVDFDIVEKRNLGRQFLFRQQDVGKLKTEVISSYIKQAKPGVKVKAINEELKSENQIKKIIRNCDVVVHCCDHPRFVIHEMINKVCSSFKKPHLIAMPSRLGPFVVPGLTACYECFEIHMENKFPAYNQIKEVIKQGQDIRFPGLAIVTSITGVLAAKEILSHVLGFRPETYNGILKISPQNLKIERIPLKRQNTCPVCGKKNTQIKHPNR
jgi:bacteriocin biosynthesis cyclodehydratase domain-containing protein